VPFRGSVSPRGFSPSTCPVLPAPRALQQRQQTLQIITAADARGQTRVVEMNRQVLGNRDRMIAALESEPDTDGREAADAS
jgi:hypothetical protein